MNYIYRNDTSRIIFYRQYSWRPGEQLNTSYPIPEALGLTCVQEGIPPDPILFHDDVVIPPHEVYEIALHEPMFSHNVSLTIRDMTLEAGAICSFNSKDNIHIPIDARLFSHVLTYELCSKIFLHNPTDNQVIISVTAVEVVS